MKILFYLPFIKMGGLEKIAIEYLKCFESLNYDVTLLVNYDLGKGNILAHEIPKTVKVKYVHKPHISNFVYKVRTLAKENKLFYLFQFFFVWFFDWVAWNFKLRMHLKKDFDHTVSFYQFLPTYISRYSESNIIWMHGSILRFFSKKLIFLYDLYFSRLKKYSKVVCISKEMQQEIYLIYPKLDQDKVKVMFNPVSIDLINENKNDIDSLSECEKKLLTKKYICSVGRLDENQKDFRTLLLAFKECKIEDLWLYIVGDGIDRKKLEDIVLEKNIKNVVFLGYQKNPHIWMKNSEAFILSSKYEGLPTVLIEGLSCGCPVISSRCPTGPAEILQEGEYGDLFEVGNVNELVKLIEQVSQKKDMEKIEKGLKSLNRYDKKLLTEKIHNFFREGK